MHDDHERASGASSEGPRRAPGAVVEAERAPGRAPRDIGRIRMLTAGGLLMGMGLGGFVDGVVIHQILQWHHMGTAVEGHDRYPATTVASLEANTLWDGLFHAGTWVLTVIGLYLMWRATEAGHRFTAKGLTGLLLAGWGAFNLVEGLIDHQIIGIHHVRDDLPPGPAKLAWDIGFLAWGALMLAGGWLLIRTAHARRLPEPIHGSRQAHDG